MLKKIFYKVFEGNVLQIINNKIYAFLIRLLKAMNRGTNTFFKLLDNVFSYIPRQCLSKAIKTRKNTIMFLTYQGDYTCNPRAIADELIAQRLPYRLIWVIKKETDKSCFPKRMKLVLRGSYNFYKAAASTKVFIDNTHNLPRLKVSKKPDQYLLQTWHGSLGIKRLDGDVVMNRRWKRLAKACRKDTDYCISNSVFEDEVFETSYWQGIPTLNYGHARNDILFTKDSDQLKTLRNKVCSALHIAPDAKILLYAPTHKDNVNESFFNLDFTALKNSLEQRFGGSWVIALRFHSRLRKKHLKWMANLPAYTVDATDYPDIQELMAVTDVGITDYSSWIFDYILLRRPGFILADDIDAFAKNRSFYYPLESTPFPIATNNEELAVNIINFDEKEYASKTDQFLKERGCIEDGHASKRIVKKIKELMG